MFGEGGEAASLHLVIIMIVNVPNQNKQQLAFWGEKPPFPPPPLPLFPPPPHWVKPCQIIVSQ